MLFLRSVRSALAPEGLGGLSSLGNSSLLELRVTVRRGLTIEAGAGMPLCLRFRRSDFSTLACAAAGSAGLDTSPLVEEGGAVVVRCNDTGSGAILPALVGEGESSRGSACGRVGEGAGEMSRSESTKFSVLLAISKLIAAATSTMRLSLSIVWRCSISALC